MDEKISTFGEMEYLQFKEQFSFYRALVHSSIWIPEGLGLDFWGVYLGFFTSFTLISMMTPHNTADLERHRNELGSLYFSFFS